MSLKCRHSIINFVLICVYLYTHTNYVSYSGCIEHRVDVYVKCKLFLIRTPSGLIFKVCLKPSNFDGRF